MSTILPKPKFTLLKTFWRQFCLELSLIHPSIHSYIKHWFCCLVLTRHSVKNPRSGQAVVSGLDSPMLQHWLSRWPW